MILLHSCTVYLIQFLNPTVKLYRASTVERKSCCSKIAVEDLNPTANSSTQVDTTEVL